MSLHYDSDICVPCGVNFRCAQNGVRVRVGHQEIISADLYECPECGYRIIHGFAQQPIAPYNHPEIFAAWDKAIDDDWMAYPERAVKA